MSIVRTETLPHVIDDDCLLDRFDTCVDCGVSHGDECPECNQRAYHLTGCSVLAEVRRGIWQHAALGMLDSIIALARHHMGGRMESSAQLCLDDAIALRESGDLPRARERARRSLAYSIGILHADYPQS